MCGRYTNTARPDQLAETFPEVRPFAAARSCGRYNVAPTDAVLAVVRDREGERRAVELRWGLIPHWAREARVGARMINARAETVAAKAPFHRLLARARGRCLVVADGWYEWLRPEDPKAPRVPMHVCLGQRRPFAFAGLWTWWRPPGGGERIASCTVITTAASPVVAPVHDRMPVVLADPAARAAWLDPALDGAAVAGLLAPCEDPELSVRPANPRVNSVANDDPECLAA